MIKKMFEKEFWISILGAFAALVSAWFFGKKSGETKAYQEIKEANTEAARDLIITSTEIADIEAKAKLEQNKIEQDAKIKLSAEATKERIEQMIKEIHDEFKKEFPGD